MKRASKNRIPRPEDDRSEKCYLFWISVWYTSASGRNLCGVKMMYWKTFGDQLSKQLSLYHRTSSKSCLEPQCQNSENCHVNQILPYKSLGVVWWSFGILRDTLLTIFTSFGDPGLSPGNQFWHRGTSGDARLPSGRHVAVMHTTFEDSQRILGSLMDSFWGPFSSFVRFVKPTNRCWVPSARFADFQAKKFTLPGVSTYQKHDKL